MDTMDTMDTMDGEVQRKVEEGVGLAAFRCPFLVHCAGAVGKQGVKFRVARGDVGDDPGQPIPAHLSFAIDEQCRTDLDDQAWAAGGRETPRGRS